MAAPTSRAKKDQKSLANKEPSTHGTEETFGERRETAARWSTFTDRLIPSRRAKDFRVSPRFKTHAQTAKAWE
jgi:hypothetical protein